MHDIHAAFCRICIIILLILLCSLHPVAVTVQPLTRSPLKICEYMYMQLTCLQNAQCHAIHMGHIIAMHSVITECMINMQVDWIPVLKVPRAKAQPTRKWPKTVSEAHIQVTCMHMQCTSCQSACATCRRIGFQYSRYLEQKHSQQGSGPRQ